VTAPTTYAELQTAIADLLHRTGDTDITSHAPDWISYAESEMQTEIKLLEFEASASITVTAGVGALPAGYSAMRSLYWSGSPNTPIPYITPEQFDLLNIGLADHYCYTISGSNILVPTTESGTVVATYAANFTPLSNSATSNAILASYPNAYLYGAMKHACIWTEDDAALQKFGLLFKGELDRINKNNDERKYGHALSVRAR
jgi:hypothetical protein